MGWKNVKEHYGIVHSVQVTPDGLCIGSPYVHDIIVINIADGKIIKKYRDGSSCNANLHRYQTEFDASPEKLRSLIESPDNFGSTRTVYTWEGAEILEKQCEELGWPNVTTDGHMMYENTFSTDRAQVVKWAIADAKAAVKAYKRQAQERSDALNAAKLRLHNAHLDLENLKKV